MVVVMDCHWLRRMIHFNFTSLEVFPQIQPLDPFYPSRTYIYTIHAFKLVWALKVESSQYHVRLRTPCSFLHHQVRWNICDRRHNHIVFLTVIETFLFAAFRCHSPYDPMLKLHMLQLVSRWLTDHLLVVISSSFSHPAWHHTFQPSEKWQTLSEELLSVPLLTAHYCTAPFWYLGTLWC